MNTNHANTKHTIYYTVDVPMKFWDDHVSRCQGDSPVGREMKRLSRTVRVVFSSEELHNLFDDAHHYTSDEFRCAPELWLRGLAASAAATKRAILKRTAQ